MEARDWADPSTRIVDERGNKLRFSDSDRLEAYRKWRYGLGDKLFATDVDQVEWRIDEQGDCVPVAILELTRITTSDDEKAYLAMHGNYPRLGDAYFEAIHARKERDHELERQIRLATLMRLPTFIVAYRDDLSEFYVQRVWPDPTDFRRASQGGYRQWLAGLRPPAI